MPRPPAAHPPSKRAPIVHGARIRHEVYFTAAKDSGAHCEEFPRRTVGDACGEGEFVEQDGLESSAVTRGHNIVYVMVHDWAASAQFLAPLLDKLDSESREVQLLVLTSDAEAVAAIAAEAAKLGHDRGVSVVAATSPARAARLIRVRPPHALVGTPGVIAELLRTATIKLETVRQVCVAWADELIANDQTTALESVMTEAPKDSARIVVTSELSPAVTELIERYARRARRVAPAAVELEVPSTIEFVTTAAAGRSGALRRVLDDVDPQTALVFVRQPDHEPQLRDLLRALGYDGDEAPVRTGLVAAPNTDVAILYDLPASRQELREATSGARRIIALVQPRQLSSLRTLAAGGSVAPLTLSESGLRARNQETRMRQAVRDALLEGQFGRELIALEPLLEEFDGIEIAAATLRLLERERSAAATRAGGYAGSHVGAGGGVSARIAAQCAAPRRWLGHDGPTVRERWVARRCPRRRLRRRARQSRRHRRDRRRSRRRSRVTHDRRGRVRRGRHGHRARDWQLDQGTSRGRAPRRGTSAPLGSPVL